MGSILIKVAVMVLGIVGVTSSLWLAIGADVGLLILSILKKYVDYEYGEIYSVSRAEVPLLYAETRDKRNLDTYECIKKIS
mgnify:CR=1 FL=1